MSVFWCLDYPRTNEQIFIKYYVLGRTWPKEEVTNFYERSRSYFRYKKMMNFMRSHFLCILNDFGFLLDRTNEQILMLIF